MNQDSTAIKISKRDYFALPAHLRSMVDGPRVLSRANGRSTFVKVVILA